MPRAKRGSKRRRVIAVGLGVLAGAIVAWSMYSRRQPGNWQHVFATREGMIGGMTSSRTIIRADDLFVALPDRRALGRDVEVRYGNLSIVVPVLDVGPWNIDDPYWEHDARPASEHGRGAYRTPVNPAGIDLSDATFAALGLRDNDYVEWRFVHRGYVSLPWL
jgi:hypothetical protein